MKCNTKRLVVDAASLDSTTIEMAASIIRSGGVVVFPTHTLYGLAADALNPKAIARIFAIKGRTADKPISVLIPGKEDIYNVAADFPRAGRQISEQLWPGGVTLVLEARADLPENLTARTGKIGIRLPRHPFASALVSAFGGPVTATSANLSGRPGCSRIEDLAGEIFDGVDLVIDAGPLSGGIGSTVVDVTTDPPTILREGSIKADRIFSVLK